MKLFEYFVVVWIENKNWKIFGYFNEDLLKIIIVFLIEKLEFFFIFIFVIIVGSVRGWFFNYLKNNLII